MFFKVSGETVDSVELKCLVVSRGLKIDRDVYQKFGKDYRIYPNALTCNSFKLPDGTIVMATDLGFHLSTLSSMFSWDNLKLFKYMNSFFIIINDFMLPYNFKIIYHNLKNSEGVLSPSAEINILINYDSDSLKEKKNPNIK